MNPIVKNIIAVVVGVIAGSVVNMGIVMIGGELIAPPEGVDPSDVESIKAHINDYSFVQMLPPFLAHALGTLVGAFLASLIAVNHKMKFAIGIGAWFFVGGATMVFLIPETPLWFTILDLGLAYIPMALIGGKLGHRE